MRLATAAAFFVFGVSVAHWQGVNLHGGVTAIIYAILAISGIIVVYARVRMGRQFFIALAVLLVIAGLARGAASTGDHGDNRVNVPGDGESVQVTAWLVSDANRADSGVRLNLHATRINHESASFPLTVFASGLSDSTGSGRSSDGFRYGDIYEFTGRFSLETGEYSSSSAGTIFTGMVTLASSGHGNSPYLVSTVDVSSENDHATAVNTTTAISAAGTFFVTRGQMTIRTTESIPMTIVSHPTVSRCFMESQKRSWKCSSFGSVPVILSRAFNWANAIESAIPTVKPATTTPGMYLDTLPSRSALITRSIRPAMNPSSRRASIPWRITTALMSGTSAAVGPVMLNRDEPNIEAVAPANAAVYRPMMGGAPTAIARAIDNGSAIVPTTRPEMTFLRNSEGDRGRGVLISHTRRASWILMYFGTPGASDCTFYRVRRSGRQAKPRLSPVKVAPHCRAIAMRRNWRHPR